MRQWHIVLALQGVQRGLTRKQLMERLEISKSTLHRELNTLLEVGAPLTSEGVNGTTRWRLLGQSELPPLGLTPLQIAVLHLARLELEPLAGSKAVTALDELLAKLQPRQQQPRQQQPRQQQLPLRIAEPPRGSPQIVAAIEEALRRRRRLRFDVEPLLVNVADKHPYLLGYCLERNAERTYKLARISACEVRDEKADRRPAPGLAKAFRHSVKAWTGERVRVRIALTPRVAWLASEYPLIANQRIEAQPDDSAIISAEVAGTVEAMRWVLSWGGEAEALEPPELRNSTRQELEAAAARYQQDPERGRTSRLNHAGTGGR